MSFFQKIFTISGLENCFAWTSPVGEVIFISVKNPSITSIPTKNKPFSCKNVLSARHISKSFVVYSVLTASPP